MLISYLITCQCWIVFVMFDLFLFAFSIILICFTGGTDLSNYTKCINSLENLLDAKVKFIVMKI